MKIMILQIKKYKYNTEIEEYKYKKIPHVPALISATAYHAIKPWREVMKNLH